MMMLPKLHLLIVLDLHVSVTVSTTHHHSIDVKRSGTGVTSYDYARRKLVRLHLQPVSEALSFDSFLWYVTF